MAVRKTERRVPSGFQPSDLGQAVVAPTCALISFATAPLVVARDHNYVLLVTDAALAARAASFEWTFIENAGPPTVRAAAAVSETRLQRARVAGGSEPRGRMLREVRSPYFVEEEEVPRAGIYVERTWQRARWTHGRTLIRVGGQKTAGRGEGGSNLVFDRMNNLPQKKE